MMPTAQSKFAYSASFRTMNNHVFPFLFLSVLVLGASSSYAQTTITYTVDYTYDVQGRLEGATYGTETSIAYGYDATSNLISASIDAPGGVAAERRDGIPVQFELHGNYPNPFNPVTTIVFDLPETTSVAAELIDVLGRRVMVL